jgi:hypothetical protein
MKKLLLLFSSLVLIFSLLSCRKNPLPNTISKLIIYENESPVSSVRLWSFTIEKKEIISTFLHDLEHSEPVILNTAVFILLKGEKTDALFQTDGRYFRYIDKEQNETDIYFSLEEPLSIDSFRESAKPDSPDESE